jgi:hypothetical protein
MKKFEVLFAKGAASRECVWKNESSSKSQLKIEVCWKWYGGTLTVEDGEDFDIEAVSLNKNSEWKKYNFLGNDEFTDTEIFIEPEIGDYEDILVEQDQGLLEEKLSEDGYELVSDQMVVDGGKIEITEL